MTMNPAYYDVKTLLDNNGFAAVYGGEWGSADAQILVVDGVGAPSELKATYEQPGVQILVRGNKGGPNARDIDAYRTAKAVSDFILSQGDSVEINGVCYKGFEEATSLAPLGKDENERFVYSMNFTTHRNRS